jgi:polyisoprenoid-binding protein YceI
MVDRAVLDVPVGKIECGHGKMNDNLRKALKAAEYPSITFVVTGAQFFDAGAPGALEVLAKGNLYVAGNGQDLEFQVSGTDTGDGALRIQGQVLIKMTDFGIRPPTAMMGLLKTKNEVTIKFDLITEYARLAEATS